LNALENTENVDQQFNENELKDMVNDAMSSDESQGVEVSESEYNENWHYRCYRRCYYYTRYHHRYRRCYRRCYRYIGTAKVDIQAISDKEFFALEHE
jgi:hypothetical protein